MEPEIQIAKYTDWRLAVYQIDDRPATPDDKPVEEPPFDTPAWHSVWTMLRRWRFGRNEAKEKYEEGGDDAVIEFVADYKFSSNHRYMDMLCAKESTCTKVKYFNIFTERGADAAEEYAHSVVMATKPGFYDTCLENGPDFYPTEEEELLIDPFYHPTGTGSNMDYDNTMYLLGSSICDEVGDDTLQCPDDIKYIIKYTDCKNWIYPMIVKPKFAFNPNEESIKLYHDTVEKIIEHSPILRQIRRDLRGVSNFIRQKMETTGRIYRGANLNEVRCMLRNNGEVGHHKRGMKCMKEKDFVSATIFPSVAAEFTISDHIESDERVVLEYDISEMTDSDVLPVNYDIGGSCVFEGQRTRGGPGHVWPGERFGGYTDPKFSYQAEVHLRSGSRPKVVRAWITKNMDEKKQMRARKTLLKLNPQMEIHTTGKF